MSGTSGDGVDASLIKSNGVDNYESIKDKYFKYDEEIYNNIHSLKDRINKKKDLIKFANEIMELERKITIFHAKIIQEFDLNNDCLIGFHGQTIYHNSLEKISNQLGDAKLLNQLTKKKIIYNFRQKDISNGGDGAPLTPLFHQLIATKKRINLPVCILNIGGIANITIINKPIGSDNFYSRDIGPGNCLIDKWVRINSNKKYDYDGALASSGEKNEIILEQAQELYNNRVNFEKRSFDVNDFDISFARGLSLVDGAKTLTYFTSNIICEELRNCFFKFNNKIKDVLLCGGGRNNKILINEIQKNLGPSIKINIIDDFKINGDFVESQAFAFLAIRSYKELPITFPNTTGCKTPCTGGDLVDN